MEPRFAEAWSAIGTVWTEHAMIWRGPSQQTAIAHARHAFSRALALDPDCAEAHNDLGVLLMHFDRSYAAAEQSMRRAIAADPEYLDAHANLGVLLSAMGQTDEAVAEYRRVQQMDSRVHFPSQTLAFIYLVGGRHREAAAEYHALRLLNHRVVPVNWGLMWSAVGARDWDGAARWLSALLDQPVQIPADIADRGGHFHRELRRLEPQLLAREKAGQTDAYSLACFYGEIGDAGRAVAALDRAVEAQSQRAKAAFVDPRFDLIRSDPRFKAFLRRMRLRR
jgi:tetratricopeptide (TPR) repeat protein